MFLRQPEHVRARVVLWNTVQIARRIGKLFNRAGHRCDVIPFHGVVPPLSVEERAHCCNSVKIWARIETPSRLHFACTSRQSPAGMLSRRYRLPVSPCGLNSREYPRLANLRTTQRSLQPPPRGTARERCIRRAGRPAPDSRWVPGNRCSAMPPGPASRCNQCADTFHDTAQLSLPAPVRFLRPSLTSTRQHNTEPYDCQILYI
jgi:hypothetical protein